MRYRILGQLEVHNGSDGAQIGQGRQRLLLAVLLMHANAPVSSERLIDGLWGQAPPPTATRSLHNQVSSLRKALGDGHLVTEARGYRLVVGDDDVDAARFDALAEQGRAALAAGDAGRAADRLHEALALWRGPAFGDLANEPAIVDDATSLDERRLAAVEDRIDADLALGRHHELVAELDRLVAQHPLRERLRGQQMLARYRSGRQADALEAYRHAREVLVREIGIEPGPELRRLHQAILEQDAALDAPARAAPPAASRPARVRRRFAVLAGLAAVVALGAFAAVRLTGPDSAEHIEPDAVALIDPSDGSITAQYKVGDAPGAVAAGGGSAWIANSRDGTVSRVDRAREQVTTIDVGGEPTALAYGSGSLWVADGANRRLAQVDSRTNRVVGRFPVGNVPRGVAVAFGVVWIASSVDGRVDRIDLTRGVALRPIPVAGGPVALAAGLGAVWVAGEESGSVIRLEPRSGAALRTIGVGNGPAALAVGEGAVWVANREDGTVSRIDPRTNAVTDTIGVGGNPVGVVAADGAVWVAEARSGALVRIDPRARRVDRRVEVGSSPAALVVADGSLWVTALAPRTSHRGGTLTFNTGPFGSCQCVDPVGYEGRNWPLISLAYDGLLSYRRAGGSAGTALVPNLATDVPEPSDGGRTYFLQLRPGVRFSNGEAVRPEDFRASIERLLRLTTPTSAPYFSAILGADACDRRRCDLRKGIETDARAGTITIRLRAPEAEFVHALAHPLAYVVPASSPLRLARARPLPGTGPYRIDAFDPDRGGSLSRNPHFRSGSEEARPDGFAERIVFSIIEDRREALRAVRGGHSDVAVVAAGDAQELDVAEVRALLVAEPNHLHSAVVPQTNYLFLNVREPPFDDVRVRRAVNLAVDRRRVVELTGGATLAGVSCQVVPPGVPGYTPVCPYTRRPTSAGVWNGPDVARARRLVAESGTAGARVDLWGVAGLADGVLEYGVRVLRRLGYRAHGRVVPDIGRYFPLIGDSRNKVQAGMYGWIPDFLTASSFLGPTTCRHLIPRSGANTNVSQFCDPGVDSLVDRALAAGEAEAGALWAEADRRVVDAAPIVPLVNRRNVLLVSDRVGNVQQHFQVGPLLDQFWVR